MGDFFSVVKARNINKQNLKIIFQFISIVVYPKQFISLYFNKILLIIVC
jgi:hypothetical protein